MLNGILLPSTTSDNSSQENVEHEEIINDSKRENRESVAAISSESEETIQTQNKDIPQEGEKALIHITATITSASNTTTIHFGVPMNASETIDTIIAAILSSPPTTTIHSVYGDVVDGCNVVSVYSSTENPSTGRKDNQTEKKQKQIKNVWRKMKGYMKRLFSCFQ